jgi:dihydrofolate synthase/folylpolyglutamate synthase
VPCVIGPQEPTALEVLDRKAKQVGAPLFVCGRDWSFEKNATGFRYEDANGVRDLPQPSLRGPHQIANAALAVACATRLEGLALNDDALAAGIAQASWPARLQRLTRGPLADLMPEGWELWLDGGHNPAAGVALAEGLQEWHDRPLDLVYGMLDTKVAAGYLEALAPHVHSLQAVRIPDEKASLSAEVAAGHAVSAGIDATPAGSVSDAVRAIVTQAEAHGQTSGRILICGSLYLAGHVLRENG